MAREVGEALNEAFRGAWTQPLPQSAGAQVRYLVRQCKGTAPVAALLGVSQRTVERYLAGEIKHPRAALAARLAAEVRSRWQPGLQSRARRAAADSKGLMIELHARLGYTGGPGTTDQDRIRYLTLALPPAAAAALIRAQAEGQPEDKLREALAEELRTSYFQDRGTRASGLQEVALTDVIHLEFGL
ncbi:telomere-protecting terminal protein Tpg [Streptomyces sp. VTCC 41912]|uniref:telomere-protecting terminal protein Tpg n=1 Tax=Streptomyces sp. VTCC 41912 TaxID=3383243 RepID=UPI003896C5DA